MPVRAPGRVSAEDNGRPKAEGKSSFSTTFYRIFSAQQTDSSSSGLPLSISKDKPSSPEKEMNTHLETSFLNWPTDYLVHVGNDRLRTRQSDRFQALASRLDFGMELGVNILNQHHWTMVLVSADSYAISADSNVAPLAKILQRRAVLLAQINWLTLLHRSSWLISEDLQPHESLGPSRTSGEQQHDWYKAHTYTLNTKQLRFQFGLRPCTLNTRAPRPRTVSGPSEDPPLRLAAIRTRLRHSGHCRSKSPLSDLSAS